jgi:hypothetical protein
MQSYSCIFRYKLESLVSDFAREVGASYRYFGHAAVAAQEREPMPKIMHGKLAGSVLSGLALIVVTAACQARAESSPLAQEVVVASRNSSAGVGQFHALHHQMRRERVVRRHFRGPRVIGIENGVVGVPVPVPQESDEAYPLEPSFGGYGYRPFPPPPLVAPPQIITLPTPRTAVRNVVPRAPSSPTPIRRGKVVVVRRRAASLDVMAYRPFAWPLAYACGPYAVAFVPIGFSPCDDPPHSAIYNTPCGVRPYE